MLDLGAGAPEHRPRRVDEFIDGDDVGRAKGLRGRDGRAEPREGRAERREYQERESQPETQSESSQPIHATILARRRWRKICPAWPTTTPSRPSSRGV